MLPAQEKMLRSFLGRLPLATAQQLARAVEMDALNDGSHLPRDLILESLRPVLRYAAPEGRTLTPLRLFCQPFEDLLIAAGGKAKLKGRIARESILPVWAWISNTLVPAQAQAYSGDTRAAITGQNMQAAFTYATEFWRTASDAICKAVSTENGRHAARTILQAAELALADAEEMALMFSVGQQVLEIQQKLPRGTAALTEDLIWTLREIYDRLLQSNPDAAPYVTVITMSRLAKPWEALRLPLLITRKTQDTLLSSTDMGLAGELLFHDLEDYAFAIRAVRQPQFDEHQLLRDLVRFTELSSAVVKEIEIRRDGRWRTPEGPRPRRRSHGSDHGKNTEGNSRRPSDAQKRLLRWRPTRPRHRPHSGFREVRTRPALRQASQRLPPSCRPRFIRCQT